MQPLRTMGALISFLVSGLAAWATAMSFAGRLADVTPSESIQHGIMYLVITVIALGAAIVLMGNPFRE